ncbi:MAG: hypothetical protein K6U03_03465 [Firmicutes bacterium]|nr:hypothetical protein [Bacillota bacterium]
MRCAIQVHPHDVRDEGAERVIGNIVERARLRNVIVEINTIEERHPYPSGVLSHNPLHKMVFTRGTMEIPLAKETFAGLSFHPRFSPQAVCGEDHVKELIAAASPLGVSVIPWVKALNGAYEGDDAFVRTIDGEPVRTWLCPTRPETLTYLHRLVREICRRYLPPAILLDRLRYPDWSGATVSWTRGLTCFCRYCLEAMKEEGLRVEEVRLALNRLRENLRGPLPRTKKETGIPSVLLAWLRFRQSRITRLAESLHDELRSWCRENERRVEFLLNLWPPAFAPWLGQDYHALGRLCDGAKHFPYHRLGGGADLAGLIESLVPGGDEEERDHLFGALLGLLGLPYRLRFSSFRDQGFPVDFVATETAKAKAAFGRTPIYTGIQTWNLPLHEIRMAVEAARRGGADGLFFYCYGWSTLEALDEIGRIVGEFH